MWGWHDGLAGKGACRQLLLVRALYVCVVNLTEARVIWEEGAWIEKMS